VYLKGEKMLIKDLKKELNKYSDDNFVMLYYDGFILNPDTRTVIKDGRGTHENNDFDECTLVIFDKKIEE